MACAETAVSDAALNAAADALTDGDLARYAAIQAAHPTLDWRGHERRAARLRGEVLGPDPLLAASLRHAPPVIPVDPAAWSRCVACGAPVFWTAWGGVRKALDCGGGGALLQLHQRTCSAAGRRPARIVQQRVA